MSTVSQQLPADAVAPPAPAEPIPVPTGDPAVLGLPSFVAGSVDLGLALVGYVPAAAQASALPIILMATALILLVIGTLNADATFTNAAGWGDVRLRDARALPVPRRGRGRDGREGLPAGPALVR